MDLADGGSLARLTEDVEPWRLAALLEAVARALEHAHSRGIIHCDLKPSNILLDADGEPLLGDFGLAWVRGEGVESLRGFAGTPAYMAPEQLDPSGKITPATDVWALGVILYELLAGRRPFAGASLDELRDAITECNPQALSRSPAVLEAIWRRCLVREPSGRFASAAALAVELKHARAVLCG
jgi:serine/threonine-protein kinase